MQCVDELIQKLVQLDNDLAIHPATDDFLDSAKGTNQSQTEQQHLSTDQISQEFFSVILYAFCQLFGFCMIHTSAEISLFTTKRILFFGNGYSCAWKATLVGSSPIYRADPGTAVTICMAHQPKYNIIVL